MLAAGAAFTVNGAGAFPDGAPWGAANPDGAQHCATCHFDAEPVRDSAALSLEGLPARAVPGTSYSLEILFKDPRIVVAGFQLLARARGTDAGTFSSKENGVEFTGAAIRSSAKRVNDNGVSWTVQWRAPDNMVSPITFYLAASAANDDGSPFGDRIHYRNYQLFREQARQVSTHNRYTPTDKRMEMAQNEQY
jgi:hypothetical protein